MDSVVKEGSIGSVLFNSRIINETDIERALAEQTASGCRFGEALVRLGIVTQEDIDWALSNQLNIPYVRLNKELIDPEAVGLVPAEMARRFNLVPIIRVGDELSVAMADPLDRAAIDVIERESGCTVSVSVGLIREIREMLDVLYGEAKTRETLGFSSESFSADSLAAINNDLTGGKLLDHLLLLMARRNVAALSLQPFGDFVRITVRRGGQSRELGRLLITRYPDIVQRIRTISGIGNSPETSAQGKVGLRTRQQTFQFQVLLLRTMGADYVTFKLNVSRGFPDTVTGLDLSPPQEEAFRSMLASRSGVVLFVMRDALERNRLIDICLDSLDTAGKTAILLGEGIGGGKTGFPRLPYNDMAPHDASSQIQAILEHDPDIIAVEEMDDGNSFMVAGRAALRGKLVLAGVPWHGSEETIKRLHSFKHRNNFVVNTIRGIVACTGVTTLCPVCRERSEPTSEELAVLPAVSGGYFRASGCESCEYTGIQGKKYLLEVLPFDREIHETFDSQGDGTTIIDQVMRRCEPSIRQKGEELLQTGKVSPEEYISSLVF